MPCQHCAQPACVDVCPAGAMRRDAASGVVWLDESRCIGCWMCVIGCPNGCIEPILTAHRPLKNEGSRLLPVRPGSEIDAADPALSPVALVAETRRKQAAFAVSGWAWRGVDAYPAFRTDPVRPRPALPAVDRPTRYLLVGAGVASARAVAAIRSRDPEGTITLVSDEFAPPYSRVLLPKYVAGVLSREGMRLHEAGWWLAHGVDLVLGDGARALDVLGKQLELNSGRVLGYDRLLVATGARAACPATPGVNMEGVETFHDLRGAEALRASGARSAVVVGGGFVAIKAAEALRARGMEVTLVVRSRLFRRSLDREAAAMVAAHLRAAGLGLVEGTDLRAIIGAGGRVSGVELEDGRRLACELVVLGAGVQAATDWLDGTGIDVAGGVIADAYLRSSVPGIWAAGDVARTTDLFSGRPVVNAIWPAAAEQGRVAGANMAGEPTPYDGSTTLNTLDLLGLPVATFGDPTLGDAAEVTRGDGRYQSRFYRDGRLVGAVFVGDITGCGSLLAEARRAALIACK